jgi:C-terminal processing protease CtpA/Prc
MNEDWDALLRAFLAKMAGAESTRDYHLAVAEMLARTHDSHSFVDSTVLRSVYGRTPPPFQVRWIEEQPTVVRLSDSPETAALGLRPGDVIIQIDGKPVKQRIDELSQITAASTPQSLMNVVMRSLLSGPDQSTVKITVRDIDRKERELTVRRSNPNNEFLRKERTGPVLRLVMGNIGYADLDRLRLSQVDDMFEQFKNTRAIIFDMRGYPDGTAWAIAPRLSQTDSAVTAQFRRNVVGLTDLGDGPTTSYSALSEQRLEKTTKSKYNGKTVMLIDERTMSQAEHTGLFFKAANGTIFIGSPTAGANGDTTSFLVPGGIRISFSGQEVRWPDGRQLQRVGLQPDVEVHPTIEGIRAGRDEVLEKAVEFLSK